MGGKNTAVVLLSGGLDSSVTLAKAMRDCDTVYALTVEYGQKHRREVESAKRIARHYGVSEHKIIKMDLTKFGGSALTDKKIKVPESGSKGIPATYVPARNTIMLSLALAYAEVKNADYIYAGVNAVDYSGYPDCRPEFIKAFQKVVDVATKKTVEGKKITLRTPLINLTKAGIVRLGKKLRTPFEKTWSCYNGGRKACGRCDSCRLRLKGFYEAGVEDPLEYLK
ncbi:MAG: 7-cyano-7-deazaguanine synthase QueC [Candidatus Altiarchaeota archaeon]|nr:7-cyano-7-deazaguanine synthase QueC [Candidatus Altiarchaeota archaeon]